MVTKSISQALIVGLLPLVSACTSGVEDELVAGESVPPSSSAESSEAEAPTTKSSPIEEPAAGDPSLRRESSATAFVPLLNWSFESASADCNGWPLLGARSIRAVPSRSGEYSCKVCANGSSPELAVGQALGRVGKGRYVLSAFVRSRAETAAPNEAIARVEAVDGKGLITVSVAPTIPVREQWDRVQTFIDLTEDAENLTIGVGSPDAAVDTCLFIDDVTFTRSN